MKFFTILFLFLLSSICLSQVSPPFTLNYDIWNEYSIHNFQKTTDGGYILSTDAVYEMDAKESLSRGYLIKLDNTGTTQWAKKYAKSGYSTKPSDGCSVFQCSDKGYIIATCYYPMDLNQSMCLIRTDSSGNYLWAKMYPGEGISAAYCVIQTADNGFAFCGNSWSSGTTHPYILKTDSNGNPLFGKVVEYPEEISGGTAYAMRQTADGEYIICGTTSHPFIIKMDTNLNIVWEKVITNNTGGTFYDVIQTSTGNYISVGNVNDQLLISKLDPSGNIIWIKAYAESQYGCNTAYSIKESLGGTFLISAGQYPATAISLDSTGIIQWARGTPAYSITATIEYNTDGSFALSYGSTSTASFSNVKIIKSDTSRQIECGQINLQYTLSPITYTFSNNLTVNDTLPSMTFTLDFTIPDITSNKNCDSIVLDSTICETATFIPNVFSPNNDGTNDLFIVTVGDCVNAYSIKIYNRWGELLFESNDRNKHWDGKTRAGILCPDGTYYYIAKMDGKMYKGFLSLVR